MSLPTFSEFMVMIHETIKQGDTKHVIERIHDTTTCTVPFRDDEADIEKFLNDSFKKLIPKKIKKLYSDDYDVPFILAPLFASWYETEDACEVRMEFIKRLNDTVNRSEMKKFYASKNIKPISMVIVCTNVPDGRWVLTVTAVIIRRDWQTYFKTVDSA